MLTKAGAKLLDFGLAKTMEQAGLKLGPGGTDLPTSPASLTAKGVILGTLQYMAPEQLEGKEADTRTDIFALGTVIYEMATGKKAFTGESQASLIAAILNTTPPAMSTLQPMAPPLDHVVTTCLAKDPDERWQTAGDLKRELLWIVKTGSQAGAAPSAGVRRTSRIGLPTVLAGLALLTALVIGVAVWSAVRSTPPVTRRVMRSVIPLVEPLPEFGNPRGSGVAISPDGALIAYAGGGHLYLRALDQEDAKVVAGADAGRMPFFSPDSQWLGFEQKRQLREIVTLIKQES